MKITFINNLLYRYGPPITLSRLIEQLQKNKLAQISVVSFLDGPLRKSYEEIGIIPSIANFYEINAKNIKQLSRTIKRQDPDVVVVNTMDCLNGCFAASLAGKPVILYVHEDIPQVNASLLHFFAFHLSDLVIFSSKYQKAVYRPLLEEVPNLTLPNGIPFDKFDPGRISASRESLGLPAGKKIVIIIGTICDRKRQDLLVLAANEILKKRDDIVFLIIGRAHSERRYDQLIIQAAKTMPQITVLEEKDDIENYLNSADILACPSSNDVTPSVILEALAMKKPVVAASIDGIPDLIGDGKFGLLIKSGNQKELEEAIIRLVDNPGPYRENIEKKYAAIRRKFSIEKAAGELMKILKQTKRRSKKYSVKLSGNELILSARGIASVRLSDIKPTVTRKHDTFKR